MIAGFQHPAAADGQPRKCALQSPECPHCGRNVDSQHSPRGSPKGWALRRRAICWRGLRVEGFDTRDLKEAKALLEELGAY
jgi:hypothetical protein